MGVNGIYGLSGSGLDVESMVKTAMKAKQAQYDKMYKKEVKQEWIKSAYNDCYNSLMTYKYTTLSNYKMQSNMNAMKGNSNNTSVVTVTANGEAAAMSHNVKVTGLASNAYLQTTSAGIKRDNASSGKSINLKDIIQNDLPGGGIKSYDSAKDIIYFKDGSKIDDASTVPVISFKVKDAATETTSSKYITTTKDEKGNIISGFAPRSGMAIGTYIDSDGIAYRTEQTEDASSGNIKTKLFHTTDDSGNVIGSFSPVADGATYNDGTNNYTATVTTNTDGSIKTVLTSVSAPSVTKTYTTQTKTFTTSTVDENQKAVSLYYPTNVGIYSTAIEGSEIYQTPVYTTTTKDQNGNLVKGFFPPASGKTGTYATGGITYNTSAVDDGKGTITTTLTDPNNAGNTLTYKTQTTANGSLINTSFSPDAASAEVNDDGTISTLATTTTTTIAVNDDGSVSSTIVKNAPTGGKVVSYSYKDLAEKTLNDLAVDVMNANGNISAVYDTVNDSMSFYNKNGGSDNMVSISTFTGTYVNSNSKTVAAASNTTMTKDLFTHLSLGMYDGKVLNKEQALTDGNSLSAVGVSGSITVDGKLYNNLTSNKVQIAGVSYNLMATGSTTVSVTQDTDTIVKNVKQFVDDYNKLLDSMNDKIYQTNYVSGSKSTTSYDPLTDAEKKGMSESEVTAWEAKAKTGLLYHSSELMDIVSAMRSAISTPVDAVSSTYNNAQGSINTYNTLGSIGISTSTDKGHLEVDETQLKKALGEDPDCVYQLFASKTDKDTDTANMGVANRLDLVMKDGLKKVSSQAGTAATTDDQSTLGIRITTMKQKMKDFQEMMDDYQTRLYKQYDAMETALAKLNSQSSYVSSAFG